MRSTGERVKKISRLFVCCSPCIVVALSSEEGCDITENDIVCEMDAKLTEYMPISFVPFTDVQAKCFIDTLVESPPPK